MNPNMYTEKAWQAVSNMPQYGDKYSTQTLEATHLLKALLDEGPSGLTQRILAKAGIDTNSFDQKLDSHLRSLPRVSDVSNKRLGQSALSSLMKSISFKSEFGDQYVSVEHILLGVADTDGYSKKIFNEIGSGMDQLKTAVAAIRGSNKVTSRTP